MKYSGAEIIIKMLEINGIKCLSGIPGGSNLPLYDALKKSRIRHVLARHEQGAGFIAQGIARVTGKPGVCFATSGPGAMNLLTAIADAKMDSVPVIAITGQVPSALIGTDAFQEVDTYGLSLSITKHSFLVKDVKDIMPVMADSFRIASSGRPGPVLIDVTKDAQIKKIEIKKWPAPSIPESEPSFPDDVIIKAADMINRAERPLLYIGGGIVSSGAGRLLRTVAEKAGIPVAVTLMGLGAIGHDHPLYFGLVGMHGTRETNRLFREADLIIAIGVRFDDRATGKIEEFCPQAGIIHVDIDNSEIDKIRRSDIGINSDAAVFLKKICGHIKAAGHREWVKGLKTVMRTRKEKKGVFRPEALMKLISVCAGREAIITTDVGQHQMWTAQFYPFYKARTFLTSGGLGTMGFGLPAAIGASIAAPEKKIVCISGDGSILMNIQELAVLKEEGADVKVVIFNNGHLGLVRQQQELFYDGNFMASGFEFRPDLIKIAEGFGIPGCDLRHCDDPEAALKHAIESKGPYVVSVPIEENEKALPMVIPGKGNHEVIDPE